MITKDNFKELLTKLGFSSKGDTFTKKFKKTDAYLKVDFKAEKLIYPVDKGFTINEKQTCNLKQNENFVVFECVHRLFEQGYKPEHVELEPKWKVGHGASGGRADIMIKDNSGKSLLIIECKTEGKEFDDAWKKTLINGGQLLSYVKQAGSTQFVSLYASDLLDDKVVPHYYLITLKDNKKLLEEKIADGESPLSYEKAKGLDVEDIFKAWKETYAQDCISPLKGWTDFLKQFRRLKFRRLCQREEHQFLGDMFEGFLDQGVKQSEGQFFTPMPIVKFILKSLPLESIITKEDEIPKVIDFACGAGHFLNEYTKEIKLIVEKEKEAKITDFYENVYGVEKEYRLSKVAKVSSFMYGQDDINVVYSDTLSSGKPMDDKNIKNDSFSVLVANPPYSVKGFLETLSETERKKYELIETVGEKSYPNNNSIETFFIERAKQLLKPGGVAGIIVPSSILTKGKAKSTSKSTNIYVATREILLKYFDMVAIAEFGSGTFGKTGTNTVTLFIRRKKENPAPADHFKNRVNAWFNYDKSKDGLFEDEHLLKQYCNHLELKFDDYQTLLEGKPNNALLETDIFKEYRKEFDKWSDIKNRKKQKTFKELSKGEQQAEINKRFITYLIDSEKEKLYYFVLASQNPQKVLIVKSPSKTAQMKEFLGYEWSAAKGNEGIKYLGNAKLDKLEGEDKDEGNVALEEEDKRVLSNIFNLNNINTPLYDPHNKKIQKRLII